MKKFYVALIAVLLAVLAIPASAQQTFGLTPEEFNLWVSSNAASAEQSQFSFSYTVTLTADNIDGASANVNLGGSGQIDMDNEMFQLSISGDAAAGGPPVSLDAELMVVGDFVYVRALDPTTNQDSGWIGINVVELLAELDVDAIGTSAGDALVESFVEGFAEGAGVPMQDLDTTALMGGLMTLSAINPETFISMSANDKGDTTTISTVVTLANLVSAPEFNTALAQLVAAMGETVSEGELAAASALLSVALRDTSITLAQTINKGTSLISNSNFRIDSTIDPSSLGESGPPVSLAFALDINVSGYGQPAALVAPANAQIIPSVFISGAINDALPTAPSTTNSVPPANVNTSGMVSVGESTVVSVPTGGSAQLSLTTTETVTISARALDGSDPVLTVFDASGAQIAYNDDHATTIAGLGFLDSAVEGVAPNGGTVTIDVASLGGGAAQIEVTVASGVAGAGGPTGGVINAGNINVGDSMTVEIPGGGNAQITLTANETVTITARALDGSDPVITVWDASGGQLAYNDDHSGLPGLATFDAAVENVAVNGTVTIDLTSYASGTSSVELVVTGAATTGSKPPAGGGAAAGPAVALTCTDAAQSLVGDPGTVIAITCPANCTTSSLWGTNTYTDDSGVCTAAIHAGALTSAGGATNVQIAPGQDGYPASTQNGITSSEWGAWSRSFTFPGVPSASAAGPNVGVASVGGGASLANSYTFSNGVSFSYPDPWVVNTESDVVTILMDLGGRAFIQVYETKTLFGAMDMGLEFFKNTYGAGAATTWGFTFNPADFQEINVGGRTVHVLEFDGSQGGEPVTGSVIIIPYSSSGYSYIYAFGLPGPESLRADALAIAATVDG